MRPTVAEPAQVPETEAPAFGAASIQGLTEASAIVGVGSARETVVEIKDAAGAALSLIVVELSALLRTDDGSERAFVLASPDDVGHLRSAPESLVFLRHLDENLMTPEVQDLSTKYGKIYYLTSGRTSVMSVKGGNVYPSEPIYGLYEESVVFETITMNSSGEQVFVPVDPSISELSFDEVQRVVAEYGPAPQIEAGGPAPVVSEADQRFLEALNKDCVAAAPAGFEVRRLLAEAYAAGEMSQEVAGDLIGVLKILREMPMLEQPDDGLSGDLNKRVSDAKHALDEAISVADMAAAGTSADLNFLLSNIDAGVRGFQLAWLGFNAADCKIFV